MTNPLRIDPGYQHHRCKTCRHASWRRDGDGFHEPLSYDFDCGRAEEIAVLVQIGKIKQDDLDEVGTDLSCPLWESEQVAVCPKHGAYDPNDCCGSCEADMYADLDHSALDGLP